MLAKELLVRGGNKGFKLVEVKEVSNLGDSLTLQLMSKGKFHIRKEFF